MRGLFLILVLAVAYTCADQCNTTPEAMACRGLLKPFQSKKAKKAITNKCIAAQPGLQATIDELKAAEAAIASLPSAGAKAANMSLPSAGAEVAKRDSDCKGGRKENPAGLLKASGKTAELATLNKCFAKEKGYLVVAAGGTSSFDVAKFKAEIKAKVVGSSSQAKTQLGLDKCPEADLVAFDVYKYMKCVKAYCATGAGPNKKA